MDGGGLGKGCQYRGTERVRLCVYVLGRPRGQIKLKLLVWKVLSTLRRGTYLTYVIRGGGGAALPCTCDVDRPIAVASDCWRQAMGDQAQGTFRPWGDSR